MKNNFEGCRDFGVPVKYYSDKTANGLTNCILDFLKYHGHYACRVNTTGIPRMINDELVWTPCNANLGVADIHAVIAGRFIAIEIKIGTDRMSRHQEKEKQRVEQAGGVYLVVKTMQGFYEWFVIYRK